MQTDSLYTIVMADSTQADTLAVDSTRVVADTVKSRFKTANVGMDTTLFYDAKFIDIQVPDRITYLLNDAIVKYKTMTLKADKITVDWNTNIITAEGIQDTTYKYNKDHSDSTMEVQWRGLPSLSDKGDVLNGFKLIYNFKSEKGRVIRGRTDFESGYYFGQSMKKVGEDVINISHGYFTTCDKKEDPHFHFKSRRIKVIPKDKVIAKPVVLYLRKIPVAIIPFAVFPHKKGRHSGVVIPSYGSSASEGNFIRGLGYYWAPNEYFDAKMLVDYYDRSGWMFRSDLNYAKRYALNGTVSGSFTRKNFATTGKKERRWDLLINHRQTIDPTMNLTINGRFVSDNSYYKDFSSNITERLNREIRSNATFSKRWSEKGFSLSANLSQTRDIESDRITQTLPQIRFSVSQRRIFEYEKKKGRNSKASDNEMRWYHSIYYNYSNQLYNQEIKDPNSIDRTTRYLNHSASISMNSPSKIFGWLTLGQSVSYQERWYDRYRDNRWDEETQTVEIDTVQGFASYRTFSYRASSSTNIYGMFNPNWGKVQAIRHVISPSISFNYRPDFSTTNWGYVDVFEDSSGVKKKYSRFMDAVSSSTQRSMSISVRNLFQMKTVDGEKEKKFDLFSVNSSTSYNFEADEFKLSPVSTSLRSTVVKNLNFNMSITHDPYKYDTDLGRRVNKLMILDDEKDWWERSLGRMTNFRLSSSIRLQGKKSDKTSPADSLGEENVLMNDMGEIVSEDEYYDELYRAGGNRFEESTAYSGLDIPWKATLSLEYSLNKSIPTSTRKTFYLNVSGMEIQLTKNWKIRYNARYDIAEKKLVNQSITFLRDMHCWQARFIWRPSGIGAPYFYFRINVKSTQLRDLKWEKRGGRRSVFGY